MLPDTKHALIAVCLMVFASIGATALTPTQKIVEELGVLDLDSVIPTDFDGWVEDKNQAGGVVNPQVTEQINKIYSQTLSRTYVNRNTGERVMLSIAYGEDQRDNMQAHLPELCYPAQGFKILSQKNDTLSVGSGEISIRRVFSSMASQRFEPITYWIMVGDTNVYGKSAGKKLAEMSYTLKGKIPDGLLFRVSSINRNDDAAYALHDSFVRSMLAKIQGRQLTRLTGLT